MTEDSGINVVAWVALNVALMCAAELFLGFTQALNAERDLKPVAIVWFALLGVAVGAGTAVGWPNRVLPPGPVPFVSVVVVPLLLAGAMSALGWLRARHSHLATWYGGAAAGMGLAIGRLVALALVAEVRAI
jgi:hypothetical protein